MAITKFDRPTCSQVATDIMKALEPVAAKHGISIDRGNGSFTQDGNTFKLPVECAVIVADGQVMNKEATDFQFYAHRYNLKPEDLFKVFNDLSTGERYKIVGCKPRSTKYPILVTRMDGLRDTETRFKFPADRVERNLNRTGG